MLKPLTLSLGLAVALGISSVGVAGLHDVVPSGQGIYPTAQSGPSEQCLPSEQGCYESCGPVEKKHCSLLSGLFKHKPKCYTYEWVLKKRRVRHGLFGGCHQDVCETGCTYPTEQCAYPSEQGVYPTGQGGVIYGSGQGGDIYGSGQAGPAYGAGQMAPAYGAGQAAPAYGAGQAAPAYGATQYSAPANGQMAPADTSNEPPAIPADEGQPVPPPADPADAGNASASAGGLLFLSPAGN